MPTSLPDQLVEIGQWVLRFRIVNSWKPVKVCWFLGSRAFSRNAAVANFQDGMLKFSFLRSGYTVIQMVWSFVVFQSSEFFGFRCLG